MEKRSPFPGMDPFVEALWPDVHTRLMIDLSNQIAPSLPDDLTVEIEETVAVTAAWDDSADSPDRSARYRPDLSVTDWSDWSDWGDRAKPAWSASVKEPDGDGGSDLAVAEPVVIPYDPPVERHLEIRSLSGGKALVTVLEVLSPANKDGGVGQIAYVGKRNAFLRSPVSYVEIDLIRQGGHAFAELPESMRGRRHGMPYRITVQRGASRTLEIYPIARDRRLPRFRAPLRPNDPDIVLDLQSAIDACYADGQYWKRVRHRLEDLRPPAAGEYREWLTSMLARIPSGAGL